MNINSSLSLHNAQKISQKQFTKPIKGEKSKIRSMKINVQNLVSSIQENEQEQQPLLEDVATLPQKTQKTRKQKVIRKTCKNTTNLVKLLPTGSVLAFQVMSPILTQEGQCLTPQSYAQTLGLVVLCGISCFLLCFTDSYRDPRGKVRYGLATSRGLLVIDGFVTLTPEEAAKYRLQFIDFFHALLSVLVFVAVALFDKNVVKCLCPEPSEKVKEMLVKVPLVVGIICSFLFVAFPSRRHGIGSPLSRA